MQRSHSVPHSVHSIINLFVISQSRNSDWLLGAAPAPQGSHGEDGGSGIRCSHAARGVRPVRLTSERLFQQPNGGLVLRSLRLHLASGAQWKRGRSRAVTLCP